MTKKILGIIFSLIFIAAFAFVLAWGIINFNKVKEGMSGTGLYTQEDLNKAHEDGYNSALKDKDEYDDLINGYRDTITELNDNISQLNTQVNNLTSSNGDYLKRIDSLLEEKTLMEDEKEKLLIERDEVLNNSKKLNDDIKKLNNQIDTLNNSISANEITIQGLNDQITGLNNQIVSLNETISANDEIITNLRKTISNLNNQVLELLNDKSANESTILALRSQVESLTQQVDSLTAINNSLNETVDALTAKVDTLKKERDNLIIENANYLNTITSLNNQVLNLQTVVSQLEQTNTLQQNTIASLNLQINNLNQQISDMSMQSQTNNNTISALNTKINELQASVKYYENYIAQLETGNQVVATFEYDGVVYNIQIVNRDSKLNVSVPESTEYKIFNGWKVNGEFIDLSTFTISSNTKIIADISYKYDVLFKVDNNLYNSQIVDLDSFASIPNSPSKEGYTFAGWTLDGVSIIDVAKNKITGTTTYFATFTKLHNVTFKYEDTVISTQTIENGKYANVIQAPNTEYKIFNGWKLNGSIIDLSTYKITSDITLVADITYRYDVKFKVDSTLYNSQIVTSNQFSILPKNPTKVGYEFVGWTLNNELVNVSTYAITEDVIFEAKFEKLYNVTFVYEDNIVSEQVIRNGSVANSVNVENTSYKVFNGWKVNNNLVNLASYKITQDTVFVADIIYKFDVQFMVDDEIYNSQIISKNQSAILPSTPLKEGYRFEYWTLNGEQVDISTYSITESITFEAIFTKMFKTVFTADNEIIDTIYVYPNEFASTILVPTREHYNFIGWSLDGETVLDLTSLEIIEDMEFIAVFEAIGRLPFTFDGNTLTSYIGTQTEITIPSSYSILDEKFFIEGDDITVTLIGDNAFYNNTLLTRVELPEGIAKIGKESFARCTNLSKINFPDTLTDIGQYAFARTSLTTITIPENIVNISSGAFASCMNLTEFNFNAIAMNDLGNYGSSSIWSISGTQYSSYMMQEMVVNIGNKVTKIPARLFMTDHYQWTSYSLNVVEVNFEENSVCTLIDDYAFYNCFNLEKINLPDTINEIGYRAFLYCQSLKEITIGENVTKLGQDAFYMCTSLKNMYYNAREITTLYNYVDKTRQNQTFYGVELENLYIGKNVESLPARMFYVQYNMSRVRFDNVIFEEGCVLNSIGYQCFNQCEIGKITINEENVYNLVSNFVSNLVSQIYVKCDLVNNSPNSNLENTTLYTKTLDGNYYIYTRVTA